MEQLALPGGLETEVARCDTPKPAPSILIVDDEPGAIQILRQALAEYPHVRFATSGSDAMRLILVKPPDIILLDQTMAGESGLELCIRLKAHEHLHDIPVIFVTARDDLQFELQALEAGAADFLTKPISPPRVRLRVQLHLQLKHQLDRLRFLSTTDALTGLANRRALDDALALEWRRASRTLQPLSLLLIDVDFFKAFNDEYGHPAGDACLRSVAAAVAGAARRDVDLAGRYGGEEFAIILPHTDESGARGIAERLRMTVMREAIPHRASPVASHVTLSVGLSARRVEVRDGGHEPVTTAGSSGGSERDLVDAADRALYLAKRGGRNRVDVASLEPVDLPRATCKGPA